MPENIMIEPEVIPAPVPVMNPQPVEVPGANMVEDQDILMKVGELMRKIKTNRELQELSEKNGISIKNAAKLSDQAEENITVGTIALLLAQKNKDPRYATLVKIGTKHRNYRVELINDYKNAAIQVIGRYKNSVKEQR